MGAASPARRSLSREPPVPLVARRSPGPLTPAMIGAIPEATSEEEREDVVLRHVPCGACGDLGCLGGLFGSCGGRFDGKFVASIPYYEQLVAELNQAILREHFARVAFAELPKTPSKLLLAFEAANDARHTRGWRGCFWRVDDDSSGDDDDDLDHDVETPARGRGSRRRIRTPIIRSAAQIYGSQDDSRVVVLKHQKMWEKSRAPKTKTAWKMPTHSPRSPPTAISFHSSSSKTGWSTPSNSIDGSSCIFVRSRSSVPIARCEYSYVLATAAGKNSTKRPAACSFAAT